MRAVRVYDGKTVDIVKDGKNVLITGTSGYGKTVFTKGYVSDEIQNDPDMYVVFFQIKPDDFSARFLRPQDKVITYSEGVCDGGCLFKWNMIKEIRSRDKSEWEPMLGEMSMIFFADMLEDQRNRIWADGARNTFRGYIRNILYGYQNCPSNKKLISAMRNKPRVELLSEMWACPDNRSMLMDNFNFYGKTDGYTMPKKGLDIFFFLQNMLDRFGGSFMSDDGDDTVYDYLQGRYGNRLFILHDHKMKSSFRIFEQYFLKYIGNELLSLKRAFAGKRMMWVLDEIDKIESDISLPVVATLCRQYGLQLVVSTQSLESLFALTPDARGEHLTSASLAGFSTHVVFHPGDRTTIETVQALFGSEPRRTVTRPASRYDRPTAVTEYRPVVEDFELASLGVGECYIKQGSERPELYRIIKEE